MHGLTRSIWDLALRTVGAASAYAAYALAFDPKGGEYWVSGTRYASAPLLPGYTFTRTGGIRQESDGTNTYEGPEIVTDPALNSATGWTLEATATISGGQLYTGNVVFGSSYFTLPTPLLVGGTARFAVNVSSFGTRNAPLLALNPGFGGSVTVGTLAVGENSFQYTNNTANPLTRLRIDNGNTATGGTGATIDSVSAKQILNDAFDSFATNEPAIVPGVGYWSRGALTNLAVQSQAFNDAAWTKNGWTATANSTVAPDGMTTAETVTEDAASTFKFSTQGITTTAAVHTFSMFAKAGTNDKIQLIGGFTGTDYCNFNLANGTVGSSSGCTGYIVDYGGGWYRCVVVGTEPAAPISAGFGLIAATTDGRTPVYLGTSRTLFLWQGQMLLGNFPDGGPIIATAAAAVAVGADALTHTIPAPTDQDQVFFAEVNVPETGSTKYAFNYSDGTANNQLLVYNDSGNLTAQITAATVLTHNASVAGLTANTNTILVVRRLGGNWRFGKIVAGAITWAASSAGTFPTGMTVNAIGMRRDQISQLNGLVIDQGIKVGTFTTDAEVIVAVSVG